MAQEFIISDELRNAVINYLGTKPYGDVYRLIGALGALPPSKPEKGEPQSNAKT